MGPSLTCGRFGRLMCLAYFVIICTQVSCAAPTCRHPHDNGKVVAGKCMHCPVCPSGWGHSEWCGYGEGADAVCRRCEEGVEYSHDSACLPCTDCSLYNRETKYRCRPAINAKCGKCMKNFFNDYGFEDAICTDCKFKPWHPDCADKTPDPPVTANNDSHDKPQGNDNKLNSYSHTREKDDPSLIPSQNKHVITPGKPGEDGETNTDNSNDGKYVGIAVAISAFIGLIACVIYHRKHKSGQCRQTKRGSTIKSLIYSKRKETVNMSTISAVDDSEKEVSRTAIPVPAEQTLLLGAGQDQQVSEKDGLSLDQGLQNQELIVKLISRNPEDKVTYEHELKRGAEPCSDPQINTAIHDQSEGHSRSECVDISYERHAGAPSLVNLQNQFRPAAHYNHRWSRLPTSPEEGDVQGIEFSGELPRIHTFHQQTNPDTNTAQNQYEDLQKLNEALNKADNIQVSELPLETEETLYLHLKKTEVTGDVDYRHLVSDLKLVKNLVRDNLKEPGEAFKHMKDQRVTVKRIMTWLNEKHKFAALKLLVDWCINGDVDVAIGGIEESGDSKKEMAASPGNPVSLLEE